eukprot:c14954_g1_i1 orf=478-1587(-)
MQQYLSSALALRQDGNAPFFLVANAKLCRKPPVLSLISSGGLSSLHLQRNYGTLRQGILNNRLGLQVNSVKAVPAITCYSSSNGKEQKKCGPKQKVIFTTLSVALALSVAILACARSAVASSQLAIPNVARSPIVARGGRELFVSAWMGLMAGCLHTLTGPDHLAALAPLSIGRTKLESVAVGALWGCGHDAGQVIFGILFLLLKDKLQIEIIRTWGARVVGMTLVAIGITGIKEAQEASIVPCLAGNGGAFATNSLPHMEPLNGVRRKTGFATFATGIVHGLQPDALIMILPALALPSRFAGAAFLSMFLLGTILSMSGYTAFIGSCSSALQKRIPRITEHLAWGSSLVAIFVGVGILASELFGLSIF